MDPDANSIAPESAVDPLVLAIDAGSSSTRALVFDRQGRRVLGWEAHRPYAVAATPDGGVTVDGDSLCELTMTAIDEVYALVSGAGRRISAVGFDTFWHSLLGVDIRGRACTPVFTWADTRSGEAAVKLRYELDERTVHERTGVGLHSSYWPAKLRWLKHSDPVAFARGVFWMSFGEYFYFRLFGERRVSHSMASGTGIFDQNRCVWDQELLTVLSLSPDKLSPLHDFVDAFSDPAGPHTRRWPQLGSVPWYLALGDGACNNVGSGGCSEDWIVVMVGTSGALRIVRRADKIEIPQGVWTYRLDRHRFVQGGALSTGGNVFAWLMKTLNIVDVDALELELTGLRPDRHGLTVLPFLAGERSPYWNPKAECVIVGAMLDTTQCDVVQAFLEAITFRFGLVFEILRRMVPAGQGIIGSGAGLIHSPAWMQIMTDVLGEPVIASAVPEATSRGAALLALEALGVLSDVATVPVPLATRFAPNSQHTEIYRAAMNRQAQLYQRMLST